VQSRRARAGTPQSTAAGRGMSDDNEPVTHYLSVCDYCRDIRTFTSEHARDQWEKHHPHQDGYGDD
jgi:hypothetical protein